MQGAGAGAGQGGNWYALKALMNYTSSVCAIP